MSPRTYLSETRQSASSETRRRILDAAHTLLGAAGPLNFTIDAIAGRAGVARMTVYYQFKSKTGLVEAISDDLAARGGLHRIPEAFRAPDALTGLHLLIEVFVRFWASERLVIRKLDALAVLDPELATENRNQRRRQALLAILQRLARERGTPRPEELEATADLLLVLTSFDAYQSMASGGRSADAIVTILTASAGHILFHGR